MNRLTSTRRPRSTPAESPSAERSSKAATRDASSLETVDGHPASALKISWRAPLPERALSSLLVMADGLVATTPRAVVGLDHRGRERFRLSTRPPTGLAVAACGGFAHLDGTRIVLRDAANGVERWHHETGGFALPAALPDGVAWTETAPGQGRLVAANEEGSVRWKATLAAPAPAAPVLAGDRLVVLDGQHLRSFDWMTGDEKICVAIPSARGQPPDAPVKLMHALSPTQVLVVRGRTLITVDLAQGLATQTLAPPGARSPCAVFGAAKGPSLFMVGPRGSAELGSSEQIGLGLRTTGSVAFRKSMSDVPRAALGGPFGLLLAFGPDLDRRDRYGNIVDFEDTMRLVHLDPRGRTAGAWRLTGSPSRALVLTAEGELLVGVDSDLIALRMPFQAGASGGSPGRDAP